MPASEVTLALELALITAGAVKASTREDYA